MLNEISWMGNGNAFRLTKKKKTNSGANVYANTFTVISLQSMEKFTFPVEIKTKNQAMKYLRLP